MGGRDIAHNKPCFPTHTDQDIVIKNKTAYLHLRPQTRDKPFEPLHRLNVPVVKENFETGGKLEKRKQSDAMLAIKHKDLFSTNDPDLNVEYPQVGD